MDIKTRIRFNNFEAILYKEDEEDFITLMKGNEKLSFSAYDSGDVVRILKVLREIWYIDDGAYDEDEDEDE